MGVCNWDFIVKEQESISGQSDINTGRVCQRRP